MILAEHYNGLPSLLLRAPGTRVNRQLVFGPLSRAIRGPMLVPVMRERMVLAENWYHRDGRWPSYSVEFRSSVIPSP
jgi:hypothetical protein